MAEKKTAKQGSSRVGKPAQQVAPESIAERAYYRFLARGGEHGHDLEDWLAAEQEANSRGSARRQARV